MTPQLGLKASTAVRQIDERLQHQPSVFEFFTTADDMSQAGLKHLAQIIDYVRAAGVSHIVIHHPMAFDHHHNDIAISALKHPERYQFMMGSSEALIELAIKMDVQVLIHGAYSENEDVLGDFGSVESARKVVFKRLDYFKNMGGNHVMFENSISPFFNFTDDAIIEEVIARQYRLCYDVSHGFITAHGDNAKLDNSLLRLAPQTVHYHFVDSMGETHDSLSLGQGRIDWRQVLQVINPAATNIYEIDLKDQYNCQEMLDSHRYLTTLAQQIAKEN